MTTHTIGPRQHLSTKGVVLRLGGTILALGAAYGITVWDGGGERIDAPGQRISDPVVTEGAHDPRKGTTGRQVDEPAGTGVRDSDRQLRPSLDRLR